MKGGGKENGGIWGDREKEVVENEVEGLEVWMVKVREVIEFVGGVVVLFLIDRGEEKDVKV